MTRNEELRAQPRLLGVWPLQGTMSVAHAEYETAKALAGMCADHKVLPAGPHITVVLRSLADCITASRKLGVRASRLMGMLEELACDTPVALAASVPVRGVYASAA